MPDPGSPRPAAVRIVELGTERQTVDLGDADRWYIVLTSSGEPVLKLETASPGATADGGLVELLLTRRAEPVVWRRALIAELLAAFDRVPSEPAVRPTVSVLVCTHRRPRHLPLLLDALRRLDPSPEEVIVVDNDPGAADCREVVERSGARYVREDRRGQDNARNAGLAVASGDIVAFTDDDCVPSPGWLAHVTENFADPIVGVSTGPGFPWALDTPAQEHIERQGGFMRGLERRLFDWRDLSPVHAGAAGAGANMMIRRAALGNLPAPWPPELGPGTPTESGDDTYVLSRFLAAGYRIVYDPRQWFQHQHRADWPALRKAVTGYGVGSMSMLLKSLMENGETEAPRGLSWVARRYIRAQWGRLLGDADPVAMMVAVAYLRGAAAGPARLRASRRAHAASGGRPMGLDVAAPRHAFAAAPSGVTGPAPAVTPLSVVVALEDGVDPSACLRAIGSGTSSATEIVTVGPRGEAPAGPHRHIACEPDDGVGRRWRAGAAAVTAGRAVLLLRASMTPDRALVEAHARQLAGGADVVVGSCHALPADDTLASSWAALESRRYAVSPRTATLRWCGPADGNVAVGAAALASVGGPGDGASPAAALVREVAAAGGRVVHDTSAVVAVTAHATLEDLIGDAPAALGVLRRLERLRQRRLWSRIVRRQRAHLSGRRAPGVARRAELDLAAPDLPASGAEPPDRLDVVLGDRRLGSILLTDRPAPETLATRVTELLDGAPHAWEELAIARTWSRDGPATALPARIALLAGDVDASVSARDVEVVGLPEDDLLAHVRATAGRLAIGTEWLVLVAPGLRAGPELLDDLAPALSASRIGCLYGSRTESPLGRHLAVGPAVTTEDLRGRPVDYVGVRAAVAAGLSDADVRHAPPRAALLWLADRALAADQLAGRLDVRGLSPQDDAALRARDAAHRAAVGWWLGARLRAAPAGPARRAARAAAGVELLSTSFPREGGRLLAALAAGRAR